MELANKRCSLLGADVGDIFFTHEGVECLRRCRGRDGVRRVVTAGEVQPADGRSRLLRIDDPRTALAYWRAVLILCLALPFAQPWHTNVPPAIDLAPATTSAAPVVVTAITATSAGRSWGTRDLVVPLIAAGVLARALWLLLGAY